MKTGGTIFFILTVFIVFAATPEKNIRLNTAAHVAYLSPLEKEIVYEINLFRSDPAKYAIEHIEPLAKYYEGRIIHYPGEMSIATVEGVKALNECVDELKNASPRPVVFPSRGLTRAANDHLRDQSQTGGTGHTGSDRSNLKERVERYGEWKELIGENIAYGNSTARQVVIFLLIDDGVKDRGHRKTLLHPVFKKVGVAYGKHPVYRTMCVMDFAGEMTDKK